MLLMEEDDKKSANERTTREKEIDAEAFVVILSFQCNYYSFPSSFLSDRERTSRRIMVTFSRLSYYVEHCVSVYRQSFTSARNAREKDDTKNNSVLSSSSSSPSFSSSSCSLILTCFFPSTKYERKKENFVFSTLIYLLVDQCYSLTFFSNMK